MSKLQEGLQRAAEKLGPLPDQATVVRAEAGPKNVDGTGRALPHPEEDFNVHQLGTVNAPQEIPVRKRIVEVSSVGRQRVRGRR